jgi:hypothetical protein
MQSTDRFSWGSSAAYLYTLKLDPICLAWEYLRRNSRYRSDFHCAVADGPDETPERWCLRHWEDPRQDSRDIEPRWLPCDTPLHLIRMAERASLPRFGFWRMPGHKVLWHDADHMSLTARAAGQVHRVKLSEDLQPDDCFAISILAGPGFDARYQAARKLRQSLHPLLSKPFTDKPRRPSPSAVVHMQILQTLDGEAAGATRRQIARAVFGDFTGEAWGPDSVWRARVRYLLKRGRAQCAHGYRRMVGADENAGGSHGGVVSMREVRT